MGACDISFETPGDFTQAQVEEVFRTRKEQDRAYNGHQDGYSGDFQTVSSIKFINTVFPDYDKAYEYCLDNAQKWDYVIGVKYKSTENILKWLVAGWGAC